jgi:hypothetical protein
MTNDSMLILEFFEKIEKDKEKETLLILHSNLATNYIYVLLVFEGMCICIYLKNGTVFFQFCFSGLTVKFWES